VTRWPVAAFVALVIATVAAFFVTQHLKVTTPLVAGQPAPVPSTINPVAGGTCRKRNGKGAFTRVSFRRMRVSFYLQNRNDNVDVWIVDRNGNLVRQIASNVFMRARPRPERHMFTWDGRLPDGRPAPDGVYHVRVTLLHQARYLLISNSSGAEPVTVDTVTPHPVVTSVTPATVPPAGGVSVTIRYTGNDGVRPRVLIYRVRAGRGRQQIKSYAATSRSGRTVWDGTTAAGGPAPPGTYVIALKLTNKACTTGRSPTTVAGAPHAVVTVG
jgi:flagellar hook assembly protein FlgD